MLNLNWRKCNGDVWCSLKNLDLSKVPEQGVYVIWHGGDSPHVVRVGQGDIDRRLLAHRTDPDILSYAKYGGLYVTWAPVPAHQRDGVERHLRDKWNPLVGDAFPDAQPIAVNSPFG